MAGLTVTGFDRKRLVDIKSDIETSLKSAFGDNIDLNDESGFGQIVGIMSEVISDQWEALENIYNSSYPSTSSGVSLSNIVQFNGIERKPAVKSTVTITFSGDDGVVVPVGMEVATFDTGDIFETIESGAIAGGSVDLLAESKEAGEIEASPGTLTEILTPLFGVLGATNALAADVGQELETDPELRARRVNSVSIPGQAHVDSLVSQLLNIDDVFDATVFSNGTGSVVDGVPAHRYRCVVDGGDDNVIAQIIWNNNPQGILSFGSTTIQVNDITGNPQDVQFTRPVDDSVTIDITITTDSLFSSGSIEQIKQDVVDYCRDNFKIGDDILINRIYTPVMLTTGVIDASILVDGGASNVNIDSTTIPTFSTVNVTVTEV